MRTTLFAPFFLTLAACGVAEGEAFFDKVGATGSGSGGGTDDGGANDASSSGWPGPISTVTSSPPTTATGGDASTGGDTESGEGLPPDDPPPGPPRIVAEPEITPNPIQAPGYLSLIVKTEDADAVRLTYDVVIPDEDDIVDLVPGEAPGTFVAQLPSFTALGNGWKYVILTPSRGDEIGASVHSKYEVALAGKAGTAGFWEAGDLIGPGAVAAMAMLSDGDVLELGTRKNECYLRRRAPDGSWAPSDVVVLLPGIECEAVDLKIAGETIFALVRRQTNAGLVWWLAEFEWGAEPKSRGLGAKGEEAYALAERGGTVAVCGTAPTQAPDEVDVLVQIFRSNMPGERSVVDYRPKDSEHKFAETARDCVFAPGDGEENLILVGDAFGHHGLEATKRSRRFTLTLSDGTEPEWVLPEDWALQSFGNAVDISDQGEIAVVGYLCTSDPCEPQSRLWMNDLDIPLGYPPASYLTPSAVTWHPAGFALVASAGDGLDNLWAFTVRAFWPDGGDPSSPAWTFIRKDPPQLHLSRSIFVGPLGEIWAGGWGANNYPAVANINP